MCSRPHLHATAPSQKSLIQFLIATKTRITIASPHISDAMTFFPSIMEWESVLHDINSQRSLQALPLKPNGQKKHMCMTESHPIQQSLGMNHLVEFTIGAFRNMTLQPDQWGKQPTNLCLCTSWNPRTATFVLQSKQTCPHAVILCPTTTKEVETTCTAEGSSTRRWQRRSTMCPSRSEKQPRQEGNSWIEAARPRPAGHRSGPHRVSESRRCNDWSAATLQDCVTWAPRPSRIARRRASLAVSRPRAEARQGAPPSPPLFGGRAPPPPQVHSAGFILSRRRHGLY
jgi:hypothetical protein